ncbi:MAG: ABC transporter ATP-binding protein [Candidatus Kaiserbacteria bacterium]|nr:ABC transporter ATP-binding protein [Candidatus Kaiserbacteria bacterium]
MKRNLLSLSDIHVHYGGVHALRGINLSLQAGEVVALMGSNGAGKSTILKTIFGLVPITSGSVCWRGTSTLPVPHDMVRKGISFVPQGRRVFANLSVEENLEIGGFSVTDQGLVRQRIRDVMNLFPILEKKRKEPSGTLSGGQQQLLAIARGLMSNPQVLLLDEPSLGLSPKAVKEVFETIKTMSQTQKTALMIVEHNIPSLLRIAHRGYILDKGTIVAEGDAQRLAKDSTLERIFTGSS